VQYFDYNATAPLHPAARAAWLEIVDEAWANPSSPSRLAARAQARLEACRATWCDAFGVPPERIVFMGGATEASNAIWAHLAARGPGGRWLVAAHEHPCVLAPAERWGGPRCRRIAVEPAGRVSLAALAEALAEEPSAVVAVMAANNETGVLQPLGAVAEAARGAGARFVCDATQWVGRLPLGSLPPADYLFFSAHKFGGPRGVAVLVLGEGQEGFRGRLGGGQEHGHQAGTEDLAAIAAMTAAWEAQPAEGWSPAGREAFEATVQDSAYEVVGRSAPRLPNTVSLLLPRHAAQRWILRLDRRGWVVSSGSACATGDEGPSHVLAAMGLPREAAGRVLRLSGGPASGPEDWLVLRSALDAVLAELDEDAGGTRLTEVISLD
jgi:cysteine desulfurase